MKPFKATYTPVEPDPRTMDLNQQPSKARIVLIIAVQDGRAVFIDANNDLDSAPFYQFTNCQSTEWRD